MEEVQPVDVEFSAEGDKKNAKGTQIRKRVGSSLAKGCSCEEKKAKEESSPKMLHQS